MRGEKNNERHGKMMTANNNFSWHVCKTCVGVEHSFRLLNGKIIGYEHHFLRDRNYSTFQIDSLFKCHVLAGI